MKFHSRLYTTFLEPFPFKNKKRAAEAKIHKNLLVPLIVFENGKVVVCVVICLLFPNRVEHWHKLSSFLPSYNKLDWLGICSRPCIQAIGRLDFEAGLKLRKPLEVVELN